MASKSEEEEEEEEELPFLSTSSTLVAQRDMVENKLAVRNGKTPLRLWNSRLLLDEAKTCGSYGTRSAWQCSKPSAKRDEQRDAPSTTSLGSVSE